MRDTAATTLEQNADETGLVSTFRSYAELARATNLGRASLYRAMQSLEEEGAVTSIMAGVRWGCLQ